MPEERCEKTLTTKVPLVKYVIHHWFYSPGSTRVLKFLFVWRKTIWTEIHVKYIKTAQSTFTPFISVIQQLPALLAQRSQGGGLRAEQWYLDSRWTSMKRKGEWAVGLQSAGMNYGDVPQLHLTYSQICTCSASWVSVASLDLLCKTCWREGAPSFLRAVSRHTRKMDVWGVQVLREDAQNSSFLPRPANPRIPPVLSLLVLGIQASATTYGYLFF